MRPFSTSDKRPFLRASCWSTLNTNEGVKWSTLWSSLPKSKPASYPATRLFCKVGDISVPARRVRKRVAFKDGGFTLYFLQASKVSSLEERSLSNFASGKTVLIPCRRLTWPRQVISGVCWIALWSTWKRVAHEPQRQAWFFKQRAGSQCNPKFQATQQSSGSNKYSESILHRQSSTISNFSSDVS